MMSATTSMKKEQRGEELLAEGNDKTHDIFDVSVSDKNVGDGRPLSVP